MKFIRFLGFLCVFIPAVAFGAGQSEFINASKLLTAARQGDTQTVQALINMGVDVNYTDATGLSLVCTAVMNNDKRAIQILQMYGADASNCDKQIKKYKNKTRVAASGEEYGFFSGLSSTHVLLLSAVGVVAVIGGVALLTDAFDSGNKNDSSSTGSHGGGGGGGGSSTDTTYSLLAQNLPYGPGCNSGDCSEYYTNYEKSDNFTYMSDTSTQDTFNYLMVSHAYDAFVRGYSGLTVVRNDNTKEVFNLKDYPFEDYERPAGGQPVNVAVITGSGVNLTGSAVDGIQYWFDETKKTALSTLCVKQDGAYSEACINAVKASVKMSHKYSNLSGSVGEPTTENTAFDLSGSGTVFGIASDEDTKLAKIIAGWEEGGLVSGDFYGFVSDGQLTVYKTGAGKSWGATTAESVAGAYTKAGDEFEEDDTLTLADGTVVTIQSVSDGIFVANDSSDNIYNGYINGNALYIGADGNINAMYVVGDANVMTLTKELSTEVSDYKNYAAIYDSLRLTDSPTIIANLSLPAVSSNLSYVTVDGAKTLIDAVSTQTNKEYIFNDVLVNKYYNLNSSTEDDNGTYVLPSGFAASGKQSDNSRAALQYLSNNQSNILINPAGRTLFGLDEGESLDAFTATFENFAPAVYSGLENYFMTVVALRPTDGTENTTITGYTAEGAGKLELSTWEDSDGNGYMSRICGLTGTGNNGALNPWCFAAPGTTDTEAAAAMAGSVALVQSAFDYMTPQQVFLLLALTADGPYLGTNSDGKAWNSETELIGYLREMYTLPGTAPSDDQYLQNFKNAFGYGMINLERATRPGTNVYFYDSDRDSVVSSSGKAAYWRTATLANTSLHASGALSLVNRSSVKVSFFDVIKSYDESMSLPRVWNISLTADNNSKHGLYMGDVLKDFDIGVPNKQHRQIGNLSFDMALSARSYNDNFGGLDDLRFAYTNEKYDLFAGYQRHFTDGESRFSGRANGVLSLVSNAVSTGAQYKYGNFAFGGRAFSGAITDENLLENDPAITSQYEPGRLGFANGALVNAEYDNDKFAFNVAFGNLHETNTVLGMYSDGILSVRGGNTQYLDVLTTYKPFENVKFSARGTFASTTVDEVSGIINNVSDIKSNAFMLGIDVGGFGLSAAMPLATVNGKMGYDYADLRVVEKDGQYEVVADNPHTEYINLAQPKRELRFSTSYKKSVGQFTDAGLGFIYRVNPNNTDAFGNESIFMFKLQHRIGI